MITTAVVNVAAKKPSAAANAVTIKPKKETLPSSFFLRGSNPFSPCRGFFAWAFLWTNGNLPERKLLICYVHEKKIGRSFSKQGSSLRNMRDLLDRRKQKNLYYLTAKKFYCLPSTRCRVLCLGTRALLQTYGCSFEVEPATTNSGKIAVLPNFVTGRNQILHFFRKNCLLRIVPNALGRLNMRLNTESVRPIRNRRKGAGGYKVRMTHAMGWIHHHGCPTSIF